MKTISPSLSTLACEIERLKSEIVLKDNQIAALKDNPAPMRPVPDLNVESDFCNALFHLNPVCTVLSSLEEGIIVKANGAFFRVTGFQESEVIGRSALDLRLWIDPDRRDRMKKRLLEKRQVWSMPLKLRMKNGDIGDFFCSAFLVKADECLYSLCMMIETTREGVLEKTLIDQELQTEKLAEKLQELDTTIRVIADAWGREKLAISNRIDRHIHANIMPYIEMLKAGQNGADKNTYIRIIEENLKNLNPMFSFATPDTGESFTASENHVIQLIRQGKSSKEIAEKLNVSTKAVSFHRSNIRRKLNLVNKKISLATYLNSQHPTLWPMDHTEAD